MIQSTPQLKQNTTGKHGLPASEEDSREGVTISWHPFTASLMRSRPVAIFQSPTEKRDITGAAPLAGREGKQHKYAHTHKTQDHNK